MNEEKHTHLSDCRDFLIQWAFRAPLCYHYKPDVGNTGMHQLNQAE